jgi:hypothetical protein
MNIRLKLAKVYIPPHLKRKKLANLFRRTGWAFQTEIPPLKGLNRKAMLQEYALFTKERAEKALRKSQDAEAARARMFQTAYELGQQTATSLKVSTREEFVVAAGLLYRILDIDFRGDARGGIAIRKCYFSQHYSPEVCRLISALDEGILAGLAGGGRLVFSQRLTEGKDCCRADFIFSEQTS